MIKNNQQSTPAAIEPLLLRVPDVARLLSIGETRTRDLIREGQLEAFKINNCLVVPRTSVEHYIQRRIEEIKP